MSEAVARALTFGSVAERYERYRPGYPQVVADLALRGLGAPEGLRGLEIGAGTGKATRLLAGRGVRTTAVEPDPAMRAVLERTTAGLPVTVVAATLETLPPSAAGTPYDVAWAAAAWHWTDVATRWDRVAALLRPGGAVVGVGGPTELVDDDLRERVARLRDEVMPGDDVPSWRVGEPEDDLRWPGTDWRAHPAFTDVEQHDLTSTGTASADDLVGQLGTVSAYLVLDAAVREGLLARIRAALPDEVAVRHEVVLHRAVRV
ncbi:class I SAM-dependent methyltransferase [Lapillicoccus jejuensis]|uniref:Methyltransferase family protein n=1 Tax=Lapillicoccus jejuensis TaxID=402171 RepID=A0A542DWT6_9MICO|nr:methyltransferase domain-containing protein [Lapillicoccus jejuensis]TQJ07561.1 methyltransferase family protein [Lapillicoccus jejuensis]